jgi:hypothetical protein
MRTTSPYGFLICERQTIPPSQDRAAPLAAKRLAFPDVLDPAAPPLRTDRHIPNSIATVRRRLTVAIARPSAMPLLRSAL